MVSPNPTISFLFPENSTGIFAELIDDFGSYAKIHVGENYLMFFNENSNWETFYLLVQYLNDKVVVNNTDLSENFKDKHNWETLYQSENIFSVVNTESITYIIPTVGYLFCRIDKDMKMIEFQDLSRKVEIYLFEKNWNSFYYLVQKINEMFLKFRELDTVRNEKEFVEIFG